MIKQNFMLILSEGDLLKLIQLHNQCIDDNLYPYHDFMIKLKLNDYPLDQRLAFPDLTDICIRRHIKDDN